MSTDMPVSMCDYNVNLVEYKGAQMSLFGHHVVSQKICLNVDSHIIPNIKSIGVDILFTKCCKISRSDKES